MFCCYYFVVCGHFLYLLLKWLKDLQRDTEDVSEVFIAIKWFIFIKAGLHLYSESVCFLNYTNRSVNRY